MNIKYSQFGTWAPKCVSEEQQAVWKCEKSSEPQLTTSWSGLLMLTDGEARLRKTLSVSKGLKGNKAAKVWLIGKQLNDSTLNRQRERMGIQFCQRRFLTEIYNYRSETERLSEGHSYRRTNNNN